MLSLATSAHVIRAILFVKPGARSTQQAIIFQLAGYAVADLTLRMRALNGPHQD
jgi:hypothetical protein